MKKTFLPWYFWSSHFVNSDLFFKTMFLKSIPISAWWHFYQILNLNKPHTTQTVWNKLKIKINSDYPTYPLSTKNGQIIAWIILLCQVCGFVSIDINGFIFTWLSVITRPESPSCIRKSAENEPWLLFLVILR